ncbi:hypothetical protein ACE6ED_10430 [Paenibacillus sp. CN-4]|uniref:hypothetical protein n=1 Tax=Paenibacillus nanchangensis TaxID=3348343 RepID=UPI0039787698
MHILQEVSLPQNLLKPRAITAFETLPGADPADIKLLALTTDGELWKLDLNTGAAEHLLQLRLPDFDPKLPVQLVASPDGKFAGISNRFGRYAGVYDLSAKTLNIQRSRGDYYTEVSTFPLAFVPDRDKWLLVHGSDWNRLDLSDPATGGLLTARQDNEREADYFHGRLRVSPGGQWIADSGWVWGPAGILQSWSVSNWTANPWEPDDGPSVRPLWQTEDWDLPVCWTGPTQVAVWGHVDAELLDEEDQGEEGTSPVIVIFDMERPEYRKVLHGMPAFSCGTVGTDGHFNPRADMAAKGDRLFLWGKNVPFQVWRISTGKREYIGSEYEALLYHHLSGLFIELLPGKDGFKVLSYT